jgi:hypothetical protein
MLGMMQLSPHNLEGNIDARTGGTEQIIAMGTGEWTVFRVEEGVEGRIVRIMRWLRVEMAGCGPEVGEAGQADGETDYPQTD